MTRLRVRIAAGAPTRLLFASRKACTVEGYSYSAANKDSDLTWDEATLKEYLKNPRAKVPGTKMIFPGLDKEKDIDNVIAYLKQFGPEAKKKQPRHRVVAASAVFAIQSNCPVLCSSAGIRERLAEAECLLDYSVAATASARKSPLMPFSLIRVG